MIQINEATISITERTVRELLAAIEEAKKVTKFTDEPLPDLDDMNDSTRIGLMRERGTIKVSSRYEYIEYNIALETKPKTQESIGYRLELGDGVVRIGSDGRCMCSCGNKCALGRVGSMERCTKQELKEAGIHTIDELS